MTSEVNDNFRVACRKLLDMVLDGEISDEQQLTKAKKVVSKEFRLSTLPKHPDIIKNTCSSGKIY